MSSTKVARMEAELRQYWRLTKALRADTKTHDALEICELTDDLEVIALRTEWPQLRRRVAEDLAGTDAASLLTFDIA